jgi:murein DD-endopeptidase MepM/ murein hydrolase activator NlpD
MDNNKSTILIIGYDDNEVKSFSINTHFIKYHKRYIAGISSFAVLFAAGIFALTFYLNSLRVENTSLVYDIEQINQKNSLLDSLKVKEKLSDIDKNLALIHSYLISRGILNGSNQISSGASNIPVMYSKVGVQDELSEVFLKTVTSVPLGLPHNGPVSSDYGYRKNPFGGYVGEFHPGIDIKGTIGDEVHATADGIVMRNDWYGGYGNAVMLDHGHGLTTLYGHLSRVNVVPGQPVKAGDIIGYLGTTGHSTGPHVHYEIRKNGEDIDPALFLTLN